MEDVPYALRDKSHIEETLRLATDDKSGDYAGRPAGGELHVLGCTERQDPLSLKHHQQGELNCEPRTQYYCVQYNTCISTHFNFVHNCV